MEKIRILTDDEINGIHGMDAQHDKILLDREEIDSLAWQAREANDLRRQVEEWQRAAGDVCGVARRAVTPSLLIREMSALRARAGEFDPSTMRRKGYDLIVADDQHAASEVSAEKRRETWEWAKKQRAWPVDGTFVTTGPVRIKDDSFFTRGAAKAKGETPARLAVLPGYEPLARVLDDALAEAQSGKGALRHGTANKNWVAQHMISISEAMGSIQGMVAQVMKKALELSGMTDRKAQRREALGIINYAAGIAHQRGPLADEGLIKALNDMAKAGGSDDQKPSTVGSNACPYCERSYCDTDCYSADQHGRLDEHGEDGPKEPRKTAEEWRAIGAASARTATVGDIPVPTAAEMPAVSDDMVTASDAELADWSRDHGNRGPYRLGLVHGAQNLRAVMRTKTARTVTVDELLVATATEYGLHDHATTIAGYRAAQRAALTEAIGSTIVVSPPRSQPAPPIVASAPTKAEAPGEVPVVPALNFREDHEGAITRSGGPIYAYTRKDGSWHFAMSGTAPDEPTARRIATAMHARLSTTPATPRADAWRVDREELAAEMRIEWHGGHCGATSSLTALDWLRVADLAIARLSTPLGSEAAGGGPSVEGPATLAPPKPPTSPVDAERERLRDAVVKAAVLFVCGGSGGGFQVRRASLSDAVYAYNSQTT